MQSTYERRSKDPMNRRQWTVETEVLANLMFGIRRYKSTSKTNRPNVGNENWFPFGTERTNLGYPDLTRYLTGCLRLLSWDWTRHDGKSHVNVLIVSKQEKSKQRRELDRTERLKR